MNGLIPPLILIISFITINVIAFYADFAYDRTILNINIVILTLLIVFEPLLKGDVIEVLKYSYEILITLISLIILILSYTIIFNNELSLSEYIKSLSIGLIGLSFSWLYFTTKK